MRCIGTRAGAACSPARPNAISSGLPDIDIRMHGRVELYGGDLGYEISIGTKLDNTLFAWPLYSRPESVGCVTSVFTANF